MTNEIINAGLRPASTYGQSAKNRLEEASRSEQAKAPAAGDRLELSEAGRMLAAEPGFDQAKVEAIKQAIAQGSYPLDARRMADSFAALEKMMNRGTQDNPGAGSQG